MADYIVVIGGSFNPPTIAHLRLMQAAVDAVDAKTGIFVPAKHEYVAKKMKKQSCLQDTLSETLRVEMLESFCKRDSRFSVSRTQIVQSRNRHDYEMLEAVQNDFPDSKLYFVVGSDKLSVLPHWHRIDEFLNKFGILIAGRGEDDLDVIKEKNPYLNEHWESFAVFSVPEDIGEISSSVFREKLRNGDKTAEEMVTQEVWEILNRNGKLPWNSITDFHEEGYRFLSNFYEAEVTYGGLTYGSNEAAFQAQKCINDDEKWQFVGISPAKSKNIGRKVYLRSDWEDVKVGLMEDIVRAKFVQNKELAEQLLMTGNKILVEGNRWGDTFWGVDKRSGIGENHLGKILMKVRDELKETVHAE